MSASGETYIGGWFQDKQQGYGEEVWPDNSRYEGNYVMGKKEGSGRFFRNDGSEYHGYFKNN